MSGNTLSRRLKRGLAICALTVASLGLAQPASAQFGAMGGSDDVFRPDYTTRDVVFFVEGLKLDEQQRYIFETLFDMYQADFEMGVEEVRDKLANMRHELVGNDPQEILNKVFEPVDEWRHKKHSLASRLILDLQDQLSPQQMELWPSFDRKLRRIKTLKDGVLTGENIDLYFVLQQLELSKQDQDAIKPIMDQYEVNLDAALQARNEFIGKSQNDLSTAIRSQDVETATRIVEQQVNYRLTVRNTTENAVAELMAVLPEETAMRLRRNTLEQAYGNVFRPTQMERVFEQVFKMEDLPEETMTAVHDLERRYSMELAQINERLVQLIREQDGQNAVDRVEKLVHRVAGQTIAARPDPVRSEFQNRDELDRKYLRDLRALLTNEQFAAIPGAAKIDPARVGGGKFSNRPTNTPTQFTGTPRRNGGTVRATDQDSGASRPENTNPDGSKPRPGEEPAEGGGRGGRGGQGGGGRGGSPKG